MLADPARLAQIPSLRVRLHAGHLAPAEYVALYVLHWQLARYGRRVAQRRSRRDPPPDGEAWLAQCAQSSPAERTDRLAHLLERYDLRGLSRRVAVALAHWLRGAWALRLYEEVPGSRDVLRLQAVGVRPVTVVADYPRLARPVLEKPDALAFVGHDLEHAWQFFHDPKRHVAQRRFAARLERALERGVFDRYLVDEIFSQKFDYLAADMNTHVVHAVLYLHAILLEFHLRDERRGPREALSPAGHASVRQTLLHLLEDGPARTLRTAVASLGAGPLTAGAAAALETAVCGGGVG